MKSVSFVFISKRKIKVNLFSSVATLKIACVKTHFVIEKMKYLIHESNKKGFLKGRTCFKLCKHCFRMRKEKIL